MTYRASALVAPAVERPPQIFGLALYLLGTGCVAMGLSQIGIFAQIRGASNLAPLPGWAALIGQLMVLFGLALAWRATKTRHRRVLAIATILWVTLLVLDFQRSHLQQYLLANAPRAMMAPHSAPLVGRATALGLLAIVVYAGGRTFAARTWATTLGVALVAADAWAQTWPVLVSMGFTREIATLTYAPPSMITGSLGLLLMGGGLFAAGKSILAGITVEEYLRAGPNSGGHARRRLDDDDATDDDATDDALKGTEGASTARLRRGLPLFVDALVGIAGLTLAQAVAVAFAKTLGLSARDVSETTAIGGQLIAVALLIVALGRLKPTSARPEGFAYAAFASLVAQVILLYFAWRDGWTAMTSDLVPFVSVAPPVLAACAIAAAATTLGTFAAHPAALTLLRKRLRSTALLLGLCAVTAFVAGPVAGVVGSAFLSTVTVVLAAYALYLAIAAAREARRIEIDVSR